VKKCKNRIKGNEGLISDSKDFYNKSKKALATFKKKNKTSADKKKLLSE
jgi:hypothetical protein